jgi:hypothetical protein
MGVDLYADLLCGAGADEPQSDGRTFLQRVLAGEFGPFEPPEGGNPDLEVFFAEGRQRWPFAVRTARDEYADDPAAALGTTVVGVELAQAASRDQATAGGFTEAELQAAMAQAAAALRKVGIDRVALWLVQGSS